METKPEYATRRTDAQPMQEITTDDVEVYVMGEYGPTFVIRCECGHNHHFTPEGWHKYTHCFDCGTQFTHVTITAHGRKPLTPAPKSRIMEASRTCHDLGVPTE